MEHGIPTSTPSFLDEAKLRALCPPRPVTRFAPSPTGHLHLGHVLSLLYVYGVARLTNATLLLRIEDHDLARCRDEYEASILEDIRWLGITPDNIDEFTDHALPTSYRQSNNPSRYAEAIETLHHNNRTYYCQCSRKAIVPLSPRNHPELRYPGTCRDLHLADGEDKGLRLRFEDFPIHFEDVVHQKQIQHPIEQGGDLLLRDRLGNYTYNFAVVVDDIEHGTNLIVRGTDLIHCTGRQQVVKEALSCNTDICYVHHPLIMDSDGQKLSKRHHAESLAARRANGDTPEQLIGDALFSAHLLPSPQKIPLTDVPQILTGN